MKERLASLLFPAFLFGWRAKIQVTLTRLFLRLWTHPMKVWSDGAAPISFPDTHQTWNLEQVEPTCILSQVAQTYVAVFGGKP